MGVSIYIVREPNWLTTLHEFVGLAGNKQFFRHLSQPPIQYPETQDQDNLDFHPLRPPIEGFLVWEAYLNTLPNREVFLDILEKLRADPTLWLEFSA